MATKQFISDLEMQQLIQAKKAQPIVQDFISDEQMQKKTGESAEPEPVPQPVKKDGFIKSVAKDATKALIVTPGVKIAQTLLSTGIFGKKAQQKTLEKMDRGEGETVNLPLLGDITVGAPKTGMAGVKQIAGQGLESASYLVGAGGAAQAGKQAIKETLKTAVKTGTKAGVKSGAAQGAGSALSEDEDVGEIIKRTATGAAIGGVAGAALPIAVSGVKKVASIPSNIAARKAEEKALLTGNLPDGAPPGSGGAVPDGRVAGKMINEKGKVVKDPVASEVIRQGIPEADVALIKNASPVDKSKMQRMLEVRKKQLTQRTPDRATDVVGDSFIENIAKPIEKLNKEAGKRLSVVARSLNGKKIDPTDAVVKLSESFDDLGITVQKNGNLNYKGSAFETVKSVQTEMNNVWTLAKRLVKTRDALQAHRLKTQIDQIVEYGAEGKGLSSAASRVLKGFRHNIDEILDTKFPAYNKVNTQFKETIDQLDQMGVSIGKRFKLNRPFADAEAGIAMRRILSNTKSRSELMTLLKGMQEVAKKYGIKVDDDIFTQANFADVLEKMFGSEAPTSFLGQIERGADKSISAGADVASGTPGGLVRGTIKVGKYIIDATRGINEDNKIKALEELLNTGLKPKSVFGKRK